MLSAGEEGMGAGRSEEPTMLPSMRLSSVPPPARTTAPP